MSKTKRELTALERRSIMRVKLTHAISELVTTAIEWRMAMDIEDDERRTRKGAEMSELLQYAVDSYVRAETDAEEIFKKVLKTK